MSRLELAHPATGEDLSSHLFLYAEEMKWRRCVCPWQSRASLWSLFREMKWFALPRQKTNRKQLCINARYGTSSWRYGNPSGWGDYQKLRQMLPWPASSSLQACMNLHTQVAAKFGCEKDFCVSHDWMGVFLLWGGGWPRSSSPPSLLASGSGNVDTQSGAQPQKPQESSWEDAGREREVEPWNALRRVSHLFTSWTQWTLSESTTSTLTSLPHLSLPLSPLFCSLTYPYASGLLTPPLPSSYW